MRTLKTRMAKFPSNSHTTPGYLAQPDNQDRHPAIVVIQEWWGLVPHIKDMAERFAREGFIALAPDLYHGQATVEPDEARKMAMALEREGADEGNHTQRKVAAGQIIHQPALRHRPHPYADHRKCLAKEPQSKVTMLQHSKS
jgi:dienelactone hydrolase